MYLEGNRIEASETVAKEGPKPARVLVSALRLSWRNRDTSLRGMPDNEKLSVFESDNAGYEVSTKRTGWNRSAVHVDKRAILPTAAVVNHPRDQFPVGITVAMGVRGQGRGNRIGRRHEHRWKLTVYSVLSLWRAAS